MAALCWAASRRSPMRWRMVLIRWRGAAPAARARAAARDGRRLGRGGGGAVLALADDGADGHLLALLRRDAQGAGGRRRHLAGRLVGLQLEQRLVDAHPVAVLLQPPGEDALRDRLADG